MSSCQIPDCLTVIRPTQLQDHSTGLNNAGPAANAIYLTVWGAEPVVARQLFAHQAQVTAQFPASHQHLE